VTYQIDLPQGWGAGERREYTVHLTNRGPAAWESSGPNPVQLGVYFTQAGSTAVEDGLLEQHFALGSDVPLGSSTDVRVTVLAPPGPGVFTIVHRLVQEQVGWFDTLSKLDVHVTAPERAAAYFVAIPKVWDVGSAVAVPITVTNLGTLTWRARGDTPVQVAVSVGDRPVDWSGVQRFELPNDVAPGDSATVRALLTRPSAEPPTAYARLVQETVVWFDQVSVTPSGGQ
jgi:hypothetical protein